MFYSAIFHIHCLSQVSVRRGLKRSYCGINITFDTVHEWHEDLNHAIAVDMRVLLFLLALSLMTRSPCASGAVAAPRAQRRPGGM